jgi:hypothetical protein
MTDDRTGEAGIKLRGEFFPMPTRMDSLDLALAERVSGMTAEEFAEEVTSIDQGAGASWGYSMAMLAIAIRQKYPKMAFSKIRDMVTFDMEGDALEFITPPKAEVVPLPTATGEETGQPSKTSSEESTDSPDPTSSAGTTPNFSGQQTSATSSA